MSTLPRLGMRLAALACLIAASCVLEPFDPEGKQCPCPPGSGLSCDTSAGEPGICTRNPQGDPCPCPPESGLVCDTSAGEPGVCVPVEACTPTFGFANFQVRWTTPNTIAWSWEPSGPSDIPEEQWDDQHREYFVIVGASEDAVLAREGVEVFNKTRNEELGTFYFYNGSAQDAVAATVADKLVPDTEYFAQLVTVDSAGCEFASGVLVAQTYTEVPNEFELFVDVLPAGGYTAPATYAVADCDDGDPCLEYTAPVSTDSNLTVVLDDEPDATAFAAMSLNQFANAYLELELSIEAELYVDYGGVGLHTAPNEYWHVEPFGLSRTRGFRLIQVPLASLERFSGSGTLDLETLAAEGVSSFQILGPWDKAGATSVRVDNVFIRW